MQDEIGFQTTSSQRFAFGARAAHAFRGERTILVPPFPLRPTRVTMPDDEELHVTWPRPITVSQSRREICAGSDYLFPERRARSYPIELLSDKLVYLRLFHLPNIWGNPAVTCPEHS